MLGMAGTLTAIAAAMAGASLFVVVWFVAVWLVCAALVALAARSRGRSAPGWLLLSIVLTPLLAALMLLAFADRSEIRVRHDARRGRAGLRLCPSCGEVVRIEARRCRFCLADLTRRVEAVAPLPSDERVEPRLH